MKVVVQRVKHASCTIDGNLYSSIEQGYLLLVGFTHTDSIKEVNYLAKKIAGLRIFEDENGKMNLSLKAVGGKILSISQFTLYADTKDGNRPAFINAMKPDYIKGFSLLGGEPFEPRNQMVLADVLETIRSTYPDKNIWCYTGYTYDKDLITGRLCDKSITEKMLKNIDILVDGKFVEELKNLKLRFKGSENQRIIDLRKTEENGEITLWEGDVNEI